METFGRFRDRRDAGRRLAIKLEPLFGKVDLILALPRGGVPVGVEVAAHLHVPLHVFVVRKLGVPGHEEYAMGAIASGGSTVLNRAVVEQLGIPRPELEYVIERETLELARRERSYSTGKQSFEINGRRIVLVDDGLATGSTMKVAVQAVAQQGAEKIVVAVPIAPASAREEFEEIADEFICVLEPETFYAVGEWYEDFRQTTDAEVQDLLATAMTY